MTRPLVQHSLFIYVYVFRMMSQLRVPVREHPFNRFVVKCVCLRNVIYPWPYGA